MNIELLNYASKKIRNIQNGEFDRTGFPEEMKGEIAKDQWYDVKFMFGMEYGYLLAMVELRNMAIKEESECDSARSQ